METGEQAAPEGHALPPWSWRLGLQEGQGCSFCGGPGYGALGGAAGEGFSGSFLPPAAPAPGFLRKGWGLDEAASLQFHGSFPLC